MPLQIRRGTTSQRLSITPLVSELVYDTTTKLVYVGDGVTAGGIAIDQDSSPDFPLGDLSDIDLDNLAEDDILRYDGTNWVNSELSLNSLDAVTITAPANNDIIKFNGTGWVNSELSFSSLVGVNLNSPEVNQVLKFNGTSWSNENEDSSFLVTAIDELTDVVLTNLVTDQVLKYNGTNWVNDNESVSDLSDLETVVITSPIADQILKYDGANWVNSNINLNQTVTTDIIPSVGQSGDHDIGSSTLKFNSAFFAGEISTEDTIRSLRSVTSRIESLATPTDSELRIVNEASQGQIFIQGNSNINIKVVGAESRLIVGPTADLETSSGLVEITAASIPTNPRYGFSLMHHYNNADIRNFNFIKTRGTVEGWDTVQADDVLGRIVFWGASATDFDLVNKSIAAGASITVQCATNPVDEKVSAKIMFATAGVGEFLPITKAELTNDGTWKTNKIGSLAENTALNFMSMPKLPTFADEVTANASVNDTPENGMMYYDSGASKIKAYQGGVWVVLA
jgi:hypothetical protein